MIIREQGDKSYESNQQCKDSEEDRHALKRTLYRLIKCVHVSVSPVLPRPTL